MVIVFLGCSSDQFKGECSLDFAFLCSVSGSPFRPWLGKK